MHLLETARELWEICRHKCSPRDEVILASGKTNHQALLDATAALAASDSGRISEILIIDGQPCCPHCRDAELVFAYDEPVYGSLKLSELGQLVGWDCTEHCGEPDHHRIFCPGCDWYCDGADARLDIVR